MPPPVRVTAPMLFPTSGRIDPIPSSIHVAMSGADAWRYVTSGSSKSTTKLITNPVATYQLLLGYYTDRPSVIDKPGEPLHPLVQHVAAWVILVHHGPQMPWGIPGLPGTLTTRRSVRCFFGDGFMAIEAASGISLESGTL